MDSLTKNNGLHKHTKFLETTDFCTYQNKSLIPLWTDLRRLCWKPSKSVEYWFQRVPRQQKCPFYASSMVWRRSHSQDTDEMTTSYQQTTCTRFEDDAFFHYYGCSTNCVGMLSKILSETYPVHFRQDEICLIWLSCQEEHIFISLHRLYICTDKTSLSVSVSLS